MAYYVNKVEHLNGDLILYQRNLASAVPNVKSHRKPTWYMKLKVGGRKKFIDRSTKLTIYEDAYTFARKEYDRLRNAVALGHAIDDYTFEKHWDDWYQRNITNGTWRPDRQRWHKNLAARYYKAYFRYEDGKSMRLNDITAQVAHGYWDWRIAYWSTHQGEKLQEYNPKRRKAKTITTQNVAKVPSKKTLEMDKTAINQILNDARERGRLQQIYKLKAPSDQRPSNRRPHFEPDEHQSMVQYLRSYRDVRGCFKGDKLNSWHKLQRNQLYHFVIFMLNSGLRPGEARQMRWRDILFDQKIDQFDETICVVGVRKATKKSQNRDVQTQPNANKTLREWRKKTPYAGQNDLVWFGQQQTDDGRPKPITSLNKSFQTFLSRVPVEGNSSGLLYNKENEKRCVYSLRHTYATVRRHNNVSWEDLSLNMGCDPKELRNHYDHSTSNSRRDDIVKVKRRKVAVEAAPNAIDPFVLEAMKKFQAGEIDDATMMGIMKLSKPSTPLASQSPPKPKTSRKPA
jgi:integrase